MFDVDARQAVMNANGIDIYDYFNEQLDAREAERRPTTSSPTSSRPRSTASGSRARTSSTRAILFLIAGLDTVSDTLTCSYAYLAQHPEHRSRSSKTPTSSRRRSRSCCAGSRRYRNGVPRVATQDVELPNGVKVPEGTAMMVSYGAANVDPTEFPDAFEVRFDREQNRHIAFGGGVHRCLGSHLARRELRITLREWHQRIPDYRIKPGHEELEYPPGLRHVKDLIARLGLTSAALGNGAAMVTLNAREGHDAEVRRDGVEHWRQRRARSPTRSR